jgi:hypothetical protein
MMMEQFEGVRMASVEGMGKNPGQVQSAIVDVTIFGLFFVLSALFVIMAGYFVMVWL